MRRKLLIVAVLLVSVTVGRAQHNHHEQRDDKALIATGSSEYAKPGAPLPPVKFYTYDKRYLVNEDLKPEGNLLLMLFNPTCEHCEEQAILFKNNFSLFNKSRLVFVAAPGMGPYLEYFINNTRMKDFKGIDIALDSSGYIDKTFQYVTLPQLNIYDKEGKLLKMFYGSTPLDSLKQYIN